MTKGKDKKETTITAVEMPQDFFDRIQKEISEKIAPTLKSLREWREDSMRSNMRIGVAA